MSNRVAEKYKHVLYITKIACDTAMIDLDLEEINLRGKIKSMEETKQEYENVMTNLSYAYSKMEVEVETRIGIARKLLEENYNGSTKGVRKVKRNLDNSNNSIKSTKNEIKTLKNSIVDNIKDINKLIIRYQEEENEVKKERQRAFSAKMVLSTNNNLFF